MKRVLSLCFGLLMCALCLVPGVRADERGDENLSGPKIPPLQGRLVLKSMPFSAIVKRKITTWVYLPPGYNKSAARYPVVYLLHGQPGGWPDCYRSGHVEAMADSLIAAGQMVPTILVAFDGDGPRGARDMTNFCNRATDNYRAEDMIVQELVPYIDATYRTKATPSQRALWGYSAGGYGALNLGFKHPDVWNVLCSHAGFYSPQDDAEMMTRILGPRAANRARWNANNPMLQIDKLPAHVPLHVYMDASPSEDGFDEFQTLTRKLQARDIEYSVQTLPKAHAWHIIMQRCRVSLLFASRCFAGDSVQDSIQDQDKAARL